MGLFKRKANKSSGSIPWIQLNRIDQLDAILEASNDKPQVIIKHSTRCGNSQFALHRLESDWNIEEEKVDIYFLDLLAYRDISNAIAERLNVIHQSPQMIVLKGGEVVDHASHGKVGVELVRRALEA